MQNRLSFASDYLRGAHPAILQKLLETNMLKTPGYGTDPFSESAREKIREACGCPGAVIQFLAGGTQTNAVMIDALLRSWQGVLAAESGHISTHEAGAVEASGHKVLTLPQELGKISAAVLRQYLEDFYADENHAHMVEPGMVYISQPTEFGTLYSLEELRMISEVCREFRIPLYVDGARLAYALACPENDVTLRDLAAFCDAFYIGGTKCGALFGEAVVVPDPAGVPALFTIIKQHGALLAKGRIAALQFDVLFTDGLYEKLGKTAVHAADRLRTVLRKKGYRFYYETPTNQIFCIMENESLERLREQADYSFWEKYDDRHTVIRLATDWASTDEEVDALAVLL